MAIREGRWLCKHCGVENLGRFEECNGSGQDGCGTARPKETKFYLPGDSPIVTDHQQLADAKSGQDWNCVHCSGANKNAYEGRRILNCVHCGNERDHEDSTHATTTYAVGEVPRTAKQAAAKERRDDVRTRVRTAVSQARPVTRRQKVYTYLGASVVVALAAFVLWYLFFATFEVTARVEAFSWDRAISIERYQTVREEDWSIPSRGREVDSERRIRSYRDVLDHYEARTRQVAESVPSGTESYGCGTRDLGNGYFEDMTCTRTVYETEYRTESYLEPVYREEPVYDTWYTYDIDRWIHNRTPRAGGNDQLPYWPDYTLAGDDERVSGRVEQYQLTFRNEEGESYTHELPEAQWRELALGQVLILTVNRVGMVLAVAK